MAAGLGTRMRSATPKHLHPLLGRRIVDWVIAAARTPAPTRSSSSRRPRRATVRRASSVARAGASRSARATPCAPRATQLGAASRRRARALGRHAAAHARSCCATLVDDASGRARRGDRPVVRAAASRELRPHRPRRVRPPRARSSRRRTRRRTSWSSARSTPRSTSSQPRSSGRHSSSSSRTTRRASSISPTRSASSSTTGEPSRVHVAPDPVAAEGDQHARRARASSRCAARPHQPRAHARRRHDRRPELDLDRAGRRARAGRDAFTRSRSITRRDVDGSPSRREIGPFAFVPSPGHDARRRREDGHLRRGEELPHRRARRRSRTSPTSATPRSARIRTSPPATSPRTSRTSPAAARRQRDREQRQDRCRQYVRCSGRGWRRCLACAGRSHHRRCPARVACRLRAAPDQRRKAGSTRSMETGHG